MDDESALTRVHRHLGLDSMTGWIQDFIKGGWGGWVANRRKTPYGGVRVKFENGDSITRHFQDLSGA